MSELNQNALWPTELNSVIRQTYSDLAVFIAVSRELISTDRRGSIKRSVNSSAARRA